MISLSKSRRRSSIPRKYCPISVTPVLSKVFECLSAKCPNAHTETKGLFPGLQFGFRKGLDTFDTLLTITSAVQKSLDAGCEIHTISLDFCSAFNCVNHEALVFKLRQMGIGGIFLNKRIEFLQ